MIFCSKLLGSEIRVRVERIKYLEIDQQNFLYSVNHTSVSVIPPYCSICDMDALGLHFFLSHELQQNLCIYKVFISCLLNKLMKPLKFAAKGN